MNRAHADQALRQGHTGSGHAAPGMAGLLGFAGTPVFVVMALWTGLSGGPGDMLCMSQNPSLIGGMDVMYALMAVFHAGPWLRLVQGR